MLDLAASGNSSTGSWLVYVRYVRCVAGVRFRGYELMRITPNFKVNMCGVYFGLYPEIWPNVFQQ